ncbi:MAG TPA: phytanoyl-CoA dioxygenase family protein [Planctomycetota bacterium]|nr:phytanoyl-CoA dioxygenase family protein [Planctomycetota bacterium]
MSTAAAAAPRIVPAAAHRRFHEDGFTCVPDCLPRDEALRLRAAALRVSAQPAAGTLLTGDGVFRQLVNVWRHDAQMRSLTFHPRLLQVVNELAGRPMRLWHDQILIKQPRNGFATEFHQDLPYWPVDRDTFTISTWIALGDVLEQSGSMAFIPGSHRLKGASSDLNDPRSLITQHPELAFAERHGFPLRAGGATFHQGYTAHRALANETDEPRVAHIVIWIDAAARCDGKGHIVTDGLGLNAGDDFPADLCPLI